MTADAVLALLLGGAFCSGSALMVALQFLAHRRCQRRELRETDFRLVCIITGHHWGNTGLAPRERYWSPQIRNQFGWHTCRILNIEDLPQPEQRQIHADWAAMVEKGQ